MFPPHARIPLGGRGGHHDGRVGSAGTVWNAGSEGTVYPAGRTGPSRYRVPSGCRRVGRVDTEWSPEAQDVTGDAEKRHEAFGRGARAESRVLTQVSPRT